jgi:branched-chain amino acid transport system permease protein
MTRINSRTLGICVVIVALAVVPALAGNFTVSLLNEIGIGALVALGLVLLTGVGGTTSFGQAAFVGIAAYASAWLTTAQGFSPWIGLAFALLLTGLSALAINQGTVQRTSARPLLSTTARRRVILPSSHTWLSPKAITSAAPSMAER